MSLVSSNRRRLHKLAENGSKGAQKALELLANPTKFLSTVQVGLTFGAILAATFGGQPLAEALAPYLQKLPSDFISQNAEGVTRAFVSFFIGSLTIICAEIVPKRLVYPIPKLSPSFFLVRWPLWHGLLLLWWEHLVEQRI